MANILLITLLFTASTHAAVAAAAAPAFASACSCGVILNLYCFNDDDFPCMHLSGTCPCPKALACLPTTFLV
jgi:hypothetical protein